MTNEERIRRAIKECEIYMDERWHSGQRTLAKRIKAILEMQ